MQKRIEIILIALALLIAPSAYAENSQVVVSIKPLHSLVAGVMEGAGDAPKLLVEGQTSLHDFSLKPSHIKALRDAKLVFYMADDFEMFLAQTMSTLPTNVRRVAMDKTVGIRIYPIRVAEEHEHDHAHEHSARDLHFWLMPENARLMVMEIARQLTIVFPEHKAIYFDNARKVADRIQEVDQDLETRMAALRQKPFIVFHDAYQYFETGYGLHSAGTITLHPGQAISAKHMQELRDKIKNGNIKCVFREPEFEGRVVDNLLEGTGAKSGTLDPEGALLSPGPELYFQLMEGLATRLEECLNPSALPQQEKP